jgi:hypothetical protein
MWIVKMMKPKKKDRNSSLAPALKLRLRKLHPSEHGIGESVVGAAAAAGESRCLSPIKCHLGSKTNKSNCDN